MTTRSQAQHDQDKNKNASTGKFEKCPVCEFCRKPAGHDYCSDAETLMLGYLGLTLCGRVRCAKKREAMSVQERLAVYAANEGK